MISVLISVAFADFAVAAFAGTLEFIFLSGAGSERGFALKPSTLAAPHGSFRPNADWSSTAVSDDVFKVMAFNPSRSVSVPGCDIGF